MTPSQRIDLGRLATSHRQGFGVAMAIAVGVTVCLAILLAAQHLLGASSRQETSAAYLGRWATSVLESTLDETAFRMFGEANGHTVKKGLGESLRSFVEPPPGTSVRRTRSGDLERFMYSAPITREALRETPEVEVGDVVIAIARREPFVSTRGLASNESRGTVAVEARVSVRLPGARLKVTRHGRQEYEYRGVLLGVPWPFNHTTFFNRALPDDPLAPAAQPVVDSQSVTPSVPTPVTPTGSLAASRLSTPGSAVSSADCARIRDRFYAYLCEYERRRAQAADLGDFPVDAMDPRTRPGPSTNAPASPATESLPGESQNAQAEAPSPAADPLGERSGPIYSVLQTVGDGQFGLRGYAIPAFFGENLTGGSPDEELTIQMLAMERQEFRKAPPAEARRLERYYPLVEAEAWQEKATHRYESMAALTAALSKRGVLDLAGIYLVGGPLQIDHRYRGHGVLVTSDPGGITIRRALREEPWEGHVTLVATRGDIRAAGRPAEIHASLMATHGTIRAFGETKLEGTVFVSYMPNDREDGPTIGRPLDGRYEPVTKPGGRPHPGLARRMRVFIHPVPHRVVISAERERP